MKIKEIISGFVLAGRLISMLFSIVFYLFFWRVDNEPGAKDVPALLWAAISFCSLGGLAFLGGNVYLIKERSAVLVVAWAEGIQQAGLIPFYSHNSKNTNSVMLAKSLDLIPVFKETIIEKVLLVSHDPMTSSAEMCMGKS